MLLTKDSLIEDDVLEGDVGIDLPGEKKKGSLGKWLVIGGTGLAIAGAGAAYNLLGRDDNVTPGKYPAKTIEISSPSTGDYTMDGNKIVPDMVVNDPKEYNFSDINDFMHALFEANVTRNEDVYRSEILHPDVKPTWGIKLPNTDKKYKLVSINDFNLDDVSEEARIDNAKYYKVMIYSDSTLGDNIVSFFLVADDGNRFWLAGGI